MKKVDEFIKTVDYQVEHHIPTKIFAFVRKHFVYFSSFLLISILGVFIYQIFKERTYYLTSVITSDLDQIEKNLEIIDKDCNILSVSSDRASIDFLNVEKFAGSMIGSINLAYPAKWKGPYLQRNPTVQGIFYELVKTTDGFYITPGRGVKLPNGLVIGRDLEITSSTPIAHLMQPGGKLNYKDEALARKIKFVIGNWDSPLAADQNTFERISKTLKEFSDALPFAQNEASPESQLNA